MIGIIFHRCPVHVALATLLLTLGCTSTLRNKQLESVAKDWALVIRASQVIPVYPLSQDVQAGDVLLVSTPVEEQVALYKAKGFLPLDQLFVRLYSKQYVQFYNAQYGVSPDKQVPPVLWQEVATDGTSRWANAPRAAFPTYRFSVDTGAGLSLAIPIQGVPFALGLMNSGKATGTVTISDVYTYGLDNTKLFEEVSIWALANRQLLSSYQPREGRHHFLRVVARVYVTGRVDVTVNNDEAMGADAAAGADRPVSLLGIKQGATAENYQSAIASINALVRDQLPGGRVKIAAASSRSVTLSETFPRPLVIGYVGFDVPILQGGRLGAPMSTLAQLTGAHIAPSAPAERNGAFQLAAVANLRACLHSESGPAARTLEAELDKLERILPKTYPFSLYENTPGGLKRDERIVVGSAVAEKGFQGVVDYLGYAQQTTELLAALHPSQKTSELTADFEAAQKALHTTWAEVQAAPSFVTAVDHVLLGY